MRLRTITYSIANKLFFLPAHDFTYLGNLLFKSINFQISEFIWVLILYRLCNFIKNLSSLLCLSNAQLNYPFKSGPDVRLIEHLLL